MLRWMALGHCCILQMKAAGKLGPFGTVGTWHMSYLDDNMRILYAIGGKNTVVENVYILTK